MSVAWFVLFLVGLFSGLREIVYRATAWQEGVVVELSRWREVMETCVEAGQEDENVCKYLLEDRFWDRLLVAWLVFPTRSFSSEFLCPVLAYLQKKELFARYPYAFTYSALWLATWEEEVCSP